MRTYLLTTPNGKQFKVTGDGDEQVALAVLHRQLGAAAAQPEPAQQGASGQKDPIIAQSADGVRHQFTAGTNLAVIDGVMKEYASQSQANAQGLKQPIAPMSGIFAGIYEKIIAENAALMAERNALHPNHLN